jgi:chromosome segregation ATPase
MDYEFKIHMLERELAHCKEMQQLMQAQAEAHDRSITALSPRLERIEANLEALSGLTVVIGEKLSALIDSLHAPRNGKGN